MTSLDQCTKCHVVAKAYVGKTWKFLVRTHAESPTFRKEWQECGDNVQQKMDTDPEYAQRRVSTKVGVRCLLKSEMSMKTVFMFLRCNEFLAKSLSLRASR